MSAAPETPLFTGTDEYIADDALLVAVNASIALERPLLVKGEPGTGKTELARQIASALDLRLIEWTVKSTSRAQHGLYEYDAVSRLRDSQLGEDRVHDVGNYIRKGRIWEAFEAGEKVVLLIDEIDKADIEFPNDLLQELDRMSFHVHETGETVEARVRPIVIITSNNEKELPDAFLRRCFFHYIAFPEQETLERIVEAHHPGVHEELMRAALVQFYALRDTPGVKKKPSTSEALDWIRLLAGEGRDPAALSDPESGLPHLHGALLKNEQDVAIVESGMFRRPVR
ncbi:MAG: MoxR family ATPase [Baekduia sp.]